MKKYVKNHIPSLIMAVIFGWLEVLFIYFAGLASGEAIDVVSGDGSGEFIHILIKTIIFLVLILVTNAISEYNTNTFSCSIAADIRNDYAFGMYNGTTTKYNRIARNDHITAMDDDIDQLRLNYISNIPYTIRGIGATLIYCIGLLYIHPLIFIATLCFTFLPTFIGRLFSGPIARLQVDRSKAYSRYINKLYELLDGYLVIKQSDHKDEFIEDYDKEDQNLLHKIGSLNVYNSTMFQSMFVLNIFTVIGIVFIGSILVNANQLNMSELISSMALVSIATNGISESIRYGISLYSSRKIKEKVLDSVEYFEIEEKEGPLVKPELSLEIQDLSYNFGENEVFNGLNLRVDKEKSYGIIGGSGSGKSTFAKILLKVNEDYGGEVLFSNGELKDFTEEELYELIYYVPQKPIVFRDTLKNNITMLAKDVDREKYNHIIKCCGLEDLFNAKSDEIISDGELSGGEAKRIEIARALYKGAEFIIFDEPTANLDPISSEKVEDLIFDLEDITRLVITHNQDIDNLERFDEVLNIEDYK